MKKLKKVMIFALSLGITMCNINTSFAYYSSKDNSNKQIGIVKKSTVTFNSNGSSEVPDPQTITKYYGDVLGTLPKLNAIYSSAYGGYVMHNGWNDKNGDIYDSTSKMPGKDLTLYAQWTTGIEILDTTYIDGGYKIKFKGKCDKGIRYIQVPTWTTNNGQDDIVWYNATIISQNTDKTEAIAEVIIDFKNHNYEEGTYVSDLYIWCNHDAHVQRAGGFQLSNWKPQLSNLKSSVSNGQITVSGHIEDRQGFSNFMMPTWSSNNGQDDIVWYYPSVDSNGNFTIVVDTSNHKSDKGYYNIHFYATEPRLGQTFLTAIGVTVD